MKKTMGKKAIILFSTALLLTGIWPHDAAQAAPKQSRLGYRADITEKDTPAADAAFTPAAVKQALAGIQTKSGEEVLSAQKDPGLPVAYPYAYDDTDNLKAYLNTNLPSIRNQNPYGSCWSHSSIAALEIYRMKKQNGDKTFDLSERHLCRFTFGDGTGQTIPVSEAADVYTLDEGRIKEILGLGATDELTASQKESCILDRGGSAAEAALTLLHWKGAAYENVAPYPKTQDLTDPITDSLAQNPEKWEQIEYRDAVRMENCYRLNLKKNPELVKEFIREYGAAVSAYCHVDGTAEGYQEPFLNEKTNCYYCPESYETNHAITIVGWDDDYPASNFTYQPNDNGAWLIRNSWGGADDELSQFSYFWMSYEDQSLAKASAFVFTLQEDGNRLDHNYYYDAYLHRTTFYEYGENKTYRAANVFEAKGNKEAIRAVTLQYNANDDPNLANGGIPYKLFIYRDLPEGTDPDFGEPAYTQSGTLPITGYYTIRLNQQVAVSQGERFSVVVELDDGKTAVDVEEDYSYEDGFFSVDAGCKEGQSYLKSGGQWKDLYTVTDREAGNFCIGVQTMEIPVLTATKTSDGKIRLSWNQTGDGQAYELRRAPIAGGSYETFATSQKASSTNIMATSYIAETAELEGYSYQVYRIIGGVISEDSASDAYPIPEGGELPVSPLESADFSLVIPRSMEYTGKTLTASVNVPQDYSGGGAHISYLMIKDADGNPVTGVAKTKEAPVDCGTYQVFIAIDGTEKYLKVDEMTDSNWCFTILRRQLTQENLSVSHLSSLIYDGKSKDFWAGGVSVSCNDIRMAKNIDYTVQRYTSEDSEINAGMTGYTVTANGNFAGSVSVNRIILPYEIQQEETAFVAEPNYLYDGTEKRPQVYVVAQNKLLTEGVDYTVSYENNLHAFPRGSENAQEKGPRCTVTGIGNYSGEVVLGYYIEKQPMTLEIGNYQKTAGQADPRFTILISGLAPGDEPQISGFLDRTKGETPGTYAIKQGSVVLVDNEDFCAADYEITFVDGTLTILQPADAIYPPTTSDGNNPSDTGDSDDDDDEDEDEDEPDEEDLEILENKGYEYLENGEIAYVSTAKNAKAVTIPNVIKVNGRTYTVTLIDDNAFKGAKNLTSVTIGKNVKKIGKKAFFGCKNLKKITFKTTKLTKKSVGAKAFTGIHKNAVIKIPKKVRASYKSFLLKKGMKKTMIWK